MHLCKEQGSRTFCRGVFLLLESWFSENVLVPHISSWRLKLNSFLLSNSSMATNIMLGPEASLTSLTLYFFFWRYPLWKDFDIQIFFYSWVQLLHRNASASSQSSCHGKIFSFFMLNNMLNLFCNHSFWLYQYFRVWLIKHFTFSTVAGEVCSGYYRGMDPN